jgi:hypothetical protein
MAVTHVIAENGYVTISTFPGDAVYLVNRGGEYRHTIHRVDRIVNGVAVTRCCVWAREGTVMPQERDCAVRCLHGCK